MGCIVFGQSHDRAGILIEPKAEYAIDIEDQDQLIQFRNLLWFVHRVEIRLPTEHISLQADYR